MSSMKFKTRPDDNLCFWVSCVTFCIRTSFCKVPCVTLHGETNYSFLCDIKGKIFSCGYDHLT